MTYEQAKQIAHAADISSPEKKNLYMQALQVLAGVAFIKKD